MTLLAPVQPQVQRTQAQAQAKVEKVAKAPRTAAPPTRPSRDGRRSVGVAAAGAETGYPSGR
ncbi:hypothetical protein ACF07D_08115 [Leucobacter sp. NPDC015123]|uniref:hypothetical protein n=1 Tax=Leucobacter sp. NPDC015123 TaxID=3364129 RepID=UPI0036F4A90C